MTIGILDKDGNPISVASTVLSGGVHIPEHIARAKLVTRRTQFTIPAGTVNAGAGTLLVSGSTLLLPDVLEFPTQLSLMRYQALTVPALSLSAGAALSLVLRPWTKAAVANTGVGTVPSSISEGTPSLIAPTALNLSGTPAFGSIASAVSSTGAYCFREDSEDTDVHYFVTSGNATAFTTNNAMTIDAYFIFELLD